MPVFDLTTYKREPHGPWEPQSTHTLQSPSLQGAISQLSRKLGKKLKRNLSQDSLTCVGTPPKLIKVYLEVYHQQQPQRITALAIDEFDAIKSLRLMTGKRIIHTGFSQTLQAQTFGCKNYTIYAYLNDPTGDSTHGT